MSLPSSFEPRAVPRTLRSVFYLKPTRLCGTLYSARDLSPIIAYPLAITQHFWKTLHPSEFAIISLFGGIVNQNSIAIPGPACVPSMVESVPTDVT